MHIHPDLFLCDFCFTLAKIQIAREFRDRLCYARCRFWLLCQPRLRALIFQFQGSCQCFGRFLQQMSRFPRRSIIRRIASVAKYMSHFILYECQILCGSIEMQASGFPNVQHLLSVSWSYLCSRLKRLLLKICS